MRNRKKLAKWKRKALDGMILASQEQAAHALRKLGAVPSHKIALSRIGTIVFPCSPKSDAHKAELFEAFREVLRLSGAWAYVEVIEAWFAPANDNGIRPMQHSDRHEAVLISAVLPSGLDTLRMFDVERTENGALLGRVWDGFDSAKIRNAFEVGDLPLSGEIH